MAKMTKSAAKKRCAEIVTKTFRLFEGEYATAGDYEAIRKVVNRIRNRAK